MKHILLYSFLISCLFSFGQTQIWSDDFENTSTDWDLTIQSGQNDANANIWAINDDEGGVQPGNCAVKTNGDKTLHVTCQGATCVGGTGAVYYPGDAGLGGIPGVTNIRAALTTPIVTTGETQLSLTFDWMGIGQLNADFAELEYSIDGGTTWNVIWSQTPGNACQGGEGEWAVETVNLPAAVDNQADLRFAFNWQNDNDAQVLNGTSFEQSFAVNNLVLNSNANNPNAPTADFNATSLNICENDCIDFTDASTGDNITAWNWTFNGANTATSTNQNPTNICWPTAGTYDVTLSITDNNGTDNVTYQVLVNDCSATPPTAAFSVDTLVVCAETCMDFTDESTGNPTSWTWDFDGAVPAASTDQNPTNICFQNPGTYAVSLTVTNDLGTDQIITPITVLPSPSIDAFGDTIIELGGVANLEAIPGQPGDVIWTPSDNIDCETCLNVKAAPSITTDYYVYIEDMNGCIGVDTVTVYLEFEEIVDVPSAFSPNGDGENDKLRVLGVGIESIDFKIFNRYGQQVYSSSNLEEGWDGTMNGKPLNQGVFVYTLKYTLIDGTKSEKSGNVTLVK